jgi:hypothetical protein
MNHTTHLLPLTPITSIVYEPTQTMRAHPKITHMSDDDVTGHIQRKSVGSLMLVLDVGEGEDVGAGVRVGKKKDKDKIESAFKHLKVKLAKVFRPKTSKKKCQEIVVAAEPPQIPASDFSLATTTTLSST